MTRTARILSTIEVDQSRLAVYLHCSRSVVSRLASGQLEPGPVSRLLDQLEALLQRDGAAAARAIVLSGAPIALASPTPPASSSCAGENCPSAAPAAEGAFSGQDSGRAMAMQQGFGRFE